MSGEAPVPALPLRVREYRTWSGKDTRQALPRRAPVRGARWGTLHCVAADGARWTLWGKASYTHALEGADPKAPEDSANRVENPGWSGHAWPSAIIDEFPVETFEPRWATPGWVTDWHEIGGVTFVDVRLIPGLTITTEQER
jgi:hypothetical protein